MMAVFDYRASDQSGGLTEGVESAVDLQSAARALRPWFDAYCA